MKYFKIKALLHELFNTGQATSEVKLLANVTVIFFASLDRNFRRKENKQDESKPTNKQLTDEVFFDSAEEKQCFLRWLDTVFQGQ